MENKEIKVSVVIPVYNTEKYVREAVESIMNQTLPEKFHEMNLRALNYNI